MVPVQDVEAAVKAEFRILTLPLPKVSESRLYTSFLLAPVEGEQLVGYQPGQYLSLRLDIPGTEHSHARNYSLSDEPATHPVTILTPTLLTAPTYG